MTTFTISPYAFEKNELSDEGMVGIVILAIIIAVLFGSLLFYLMSTFDRPSMQAQYEANVQTTLSEPASSLPQ